MPRSDQNPEGDGCVDVFWRPDGSFGFEEFRKDPEVKGTKTTIGSLSWPFASASQELSPAAELCRIKPGDHQLCVVLSYRSRRCAAAR